MGKLQGRLRVAFELMTESNGKILDIGCAQGYFLTRLKTSQAKIGIDISKKALRSAHKVCEAQFVCADATHLPFINNFFDIAICLEIIEHLSNDTQAVKEAFRVLHKDGKLILSAPRYKIFFNVLDMSLWLTHNHKRRYSIERLINLIQKKGFSIQIIRSSGFVISQIRFLIESAFNQIAKPIPSLLQKLLVNISDREYCLKSGVTVFVKARKI